MENKITGILELENLSCGYKIVNNKYNTVVTDLYLRANHGELVALIGANGIGKSTLLKTIAHILPPIKGDIKIDNIHTNNIQHNQLAELIGFVSTEKISLPHCSFYEFVSLGRHPYTNWWGSLTPEDQSIIENALQLVNALRLKNKPIDEASDGEKQKALIARALAQQTRILLLDEPTAFLDISAKYETICLLSKLARQENKAIIFSTHDLEIAISFADKIWLLEQNKAVEGAPEDLIIHGHFNPLLASAGLTIDSLTGKIIQHKSWTGEIAVQGKGISCNWTKRALERLGFKVTDIPDTPLKIVVKEEKDTVYWMVNFAKKEYRFNTLYELCVLINNKFRNTEFQK